GAQGFGLPVGVAAALPFVGTALGDHVDHTAGGAAVLGAVATGEGLHFAQRIEGQGAATDVGQRVGDRVTVDVVRIFRRRRAAEAGHGNATGGVAGVGDHAGRQQGDAGDVTADRD